MESNEQNFGIDEQEELVVLETGQRLRVHETRRYLVHGDGSPFFYLGDTAWELFHRLSRQEVEIYLGDRAGKGFTVIQAVLLAELKGLTEPNAEGHCPLHDLDPTRPNEDYFQHVDFVLATAQRLGLWMGLLPTWGDKVQRKWGSEPEIFTPETAFLYGRFLGQRYRTAQLIWILGGDRNPDTEEHLQIWRSMAAGLREGDRGQHLMTFHCQTNSANWFHNDDWLDFNMIQSGHQQKDAPNDVLTEQNYQLTPTKPTLDGEPRYEDLPVQFWQFPLPKNWEQMSTQTLTRYYRKGWFDAYDVRQAAYWSLLAGAMGHTYGNNNIWQLWQPGRYGFLPARSPWNEALNQPGAVQMTYVRRLFESRPFTQLIPDQAVLHRPPVRTQHHQRLARALDNSFLIAYTPTGKPIRVHLEAIANPPIIAHWYNPRTGAATRLADIPENRGVQTFKPPSHGRDNDWILVLDQGDRHYPPPGQSI